MQVAGASVYYWASDPAGMCIVLVDAPDAPAAVMARGSSRYPGVFAVRAISRPLDERLPDMVSLLSHRLGAEGYRRVMPSPAPWIDQQSAAGRAGLSAILAAGAGGLTTVDIAR
jgi:hypothetical protein